ncbi:hypothetical protein L1987_59852 [Smallanthus sonchifolius]|uniref:Uncharacterized protein n=1 Tax=Smallanthus sonchifolius TaxID=185202 RepID=A0ACB9D6H3_9ASTR|nr:hypothetical protein L1987_59852 [Smallanthus sonchifolius]
MEGPPILNFNNVEETSTRYKNQLLPNVDNQNQGNPEVNVANQAPHRLQPQAERMHDTNEGVGQSLLGPNPNNNGRGGFGYQGGDGFVNQGWNNFNPNDGGGQYNHGGFEYN